jgi:hypothetical protein
MVRYGTKILYEKMFFSPHAIYLTCVLVSVGSRKIQLHLKENCGCWFKEATLCLGIDAPPSSLLDPKWVQLC